MSARKLAAAVGHSEGWVRTRLGPAHAPRRRPRRAPRRDDHPRRRHGPDRRSPSTSSWSSSSSLATGLSVWQIESAAPRAAGRRCAVADASAAARRRRGRRRQRGRLAREPAIVEDAGRPRPRPSRRTRTSRATPSCCQVPPRRHRGRDPGLHRAAPPSWPQARQRARRRTGRADSRPSWPSSADRRGAPPGDRAPARRGWPSGCGGRPIAASDAFPLAVATWIDSAPYAVVEAGRRAARRRRTRARLPGLHGASRTASSPPNPKRLAAVAVALVAATAEDRARQSLRSTDRRPLPRRHRTPRLPTHRLGTHPTPHRRLTVATTSPIEGPGPRPGSGPSRARPPTDPTLDFCTYAPMVPVRVTNAAFGRHGRRVMSLWKLRVGVESYYLAQIASGLDEYYTGAGEAPGVWIGTGSPLLGLDGDVDGDDLRAVLAGLAPGTGLTPERHPAHVAPAAGARASISRSPCPKSVSVAVGARRSARAGRGDRRLRGRARRGAGVAGAGGVLRAARHEQPQDGAATRPSSALAGWSPRGSSPRSSRTAPRGSATRTCTGTSWSPTWPAGSTAAGRRSTAPPCTRHGGPSV